MGGRVAADDVTALNLFRKACNEARSDACTDLATMYCMGRGMRLPTKDEALALAASYASCAFGNWGTWTSTAAPASAP